MNNQFLSITDAAEHYQVSSNTIRRIVQKIKHTEHVKKVAIKGRHGFKYLISVQYLDSIYNSQGKSNNNQNNNQFDNQLNNQNDNLIDNLNNQIDKQNQIIDKLTDTIKDQNKVIVSQSMQIHQLTSTANKTNAPEQEQYSLFEKLIISVLVIVILAVCYFLFFM